MTIHPFIDNPLPLNADPRKAEASVQGEIQGEAWDCHAHVLGPFNEYPLHENRGYTPMENNEQAYFSHLQSLGVARGVLVQPSVYGDDNSLLCNVLARNHSRLRGIAVFGAHTDEKAVHAMHAAGVRGFRLNLLFPGGAGLETLKHSAELVADLGWHAQLLLDIRVLPEIEDKLARLPVPVVFDHMGHFPYELGTEWPGFSRLLRRIEAGNTYIKLSGSYRLSQRTSHITDVAAIAKKLIDFAPERMLWGSDWPHVGIDTPTPETRKLYEGIAQWCPDAALRQTILCATPKKLYF